MISIINLPSEMPSEYFAVPPRSRSLGDAIMFSHEKTPISASYTPDGKPIGFLRAEAPSILWQNVLQRSMVYKLEEDGLQLRSKSCNNICKMCDQKISGENCPESGKDSFWRLHDEHTQHHCPVAKLIAKTGTAVNEAGQILIRVERSIAKEISELAS